jgi:signal transduction histidine kinase
VGTGSRAAIVAACLILLLVGTLLDIVTPQAFIGAILLNVPIALSGVAFSRTFTMATVVLALASTAVVGYLNALAHGALDTTSLLNRVLLGASFLLVGTLTERVATVSGRVGELRALEERARRERDTDRVLAAVSPSHDLADALMRAAEALAPALGANGVVVAVVEDDRVAEPRGAWPMSLERWPSGTPLPPLLVGRPFPRAVQIRDPRPVLLALMARPQRPGIVVAAFEASESAASLLDGLLPSLHALVERIELLADLERERTEVQRRADVIRDLVYAFSHDMRTPMVANAMSMRLALDGTYGELSSEYRESLEHGLAANQDLLELADALLVVAKYESGDAPRHREPVNISEAARTVVARLSGAALARGVTVRVEGDPAAVVLGDAADLRRAIQNLVENAIRYSPTGREVLVRVSAGRSIVLDVEDHGPGIPREVEERLFQRFSSGRAGGGSGLGLYLTRRIAEAHGGRISHERPVGGGSVFRVELPAGGVHA